MSAVDATTAAVAAAADDVRLLDPFWNYLMVNYRPVIQHHAFNMVLMMILFFGWCLPFSILDWFRIGKRFKVQPGKYPSAGDIGWFLFWWTFNQILLVIPVAALQVYMGLTTELPDRAPTVAALLGDLFLVLVLHDFLFFATHVFLHIPWVYRHVHYLHHAYSAPSAISTQLLHPVEYLIQGLSATLPPLAFKIHPITLWVWFVLVMWYAVEGHSGYDFGLNRLSGGIYFGSTSHDLHHRIHHSNYGTWFTFWDRVFGCYITPGSDEDLETLGLKPSTSAITAGIADNNKAKSE